MRSLPQPQPTHNLVLVERMVMMMVMVVVMVMMIVMMIVLMVVMMVVRMVVIASFKNIFNSPYSTCVVTDAQTHHFSCQIT